MQWNDHSRLVGQHAFLGASKYHWLNYDTQRLVDAFMSCQAKEKGTRLHAFAAECINLKQKLPKSKKTLNAYVNDAIGFRMDPEQVLFYSENCFGTADAIAFNDKDNFLRIHDLKTGAVPAHMEQLFIYDALFCMEYHVKPKDILIENRIYQNDDVLIETPTADIQLRKTLKTTTARVPTLIFWSITAQSAIPAAILGVPVIILISTLVTFCLVWKHSRRRACPRMKF